MQPLLFCASYIYIAIAKYARGAIADLAAYIIYVQQAAVYLTEIIRLASHVYNRLPSTVS